MYVYSGEVNDKFFIALKKYNTLRVHSIIYNSKLLILKNPG